MAQELSKNTKLAWRRLLIGEAGTEGMLVLRERAPRVTGNGDSHKIVFDSGKAEGFLLALDYIYDLEPS